MSYCYMMRYKGQYNLSVPYDIEKNEFVRDNADGYENYYDVSIDCKKGCIFHWGGSILVASFESIQTKNSVLSKLDPSVIINPNYNWCDFTFNAKNIESVATVMKAKTSHKKRSPFSTKNLPKEKYIPNNAELMKEVSGLLFKKYGLRGTLDCQKKYIKKFKIKIPNENKLKLIELLDQNNVLEKMKESEQLA